MKPYAVECGLRTNFPPPVELRSKGLVDGDGAMGNKIPLSIFFFYPMDNLIGNIRNINSAQLLPSTGTTWCCFYRGNSANS